MRVYLIQHGQAKSKEEDPRRGLTDLGIQTTRRQAELFAETNPVIHVIWHSGKQRALQTAEIFAEALGIPQRILEHTGLNPDDPPMPLAQELSSSHHDIMVVGHLPFLSRLAGVLLSCKEDTEPITFTNSAVICLSRTDSTWKVDWVLPPELIVPIR
ncbi:MAG: phosphohistidine phosphatase SixA [Spirochaetales bacterium]|nr:phosphohistidine phosphatase SixA [Spirochaetales bacterium]